MGLGPVKPIAVDGMGPDLHHRTADNDAFQNRACHSTCSNPGRCFPSRRAAAPTIVADPVLSEIGVVCVAGSKGLRNLRIVPATLIDIFDHHGDGRSGCDLAVRLSVFEDTRQDFHGVGFLPLRHELALARASFFQPDLNVGLCQLKAWRAPVDDTA